MNTKHFFLTDQAAEVPSRWRQAFPQGEAFDEAALLALLQSRSAPPCLIWLSSSAADWSVRVQEILKTWPEARLLLLSNAPDSPEGLTAFNLGVRAYTHAYGVPAMLQEVATVVEHGGLWVGPDLMQRLVGTTNAALAVHQKPSSLSITASKSEWTALSAREAQVAKAVQAGCSNKEVANQMFISERTVKAHLGAIFEKLGVRDRLQLVLRLAVAPEVARVSSKDLTP